MQNLNKLIRFFKHHLSLNSNGQGNSFLDMGEYLMNFLRSKSIVEIFKTMWCGTTKLIHIRSFFSDCKDKYNISKSGKRSQVNTNGVGKSYTMQYGLSDSRCSIFSNGEKRIAGNVVNFRKQFGLFKFVSKFVPFNLAKYSMISATTLLFAIVSNVSFIPSVRSNEIKMNWDSGHNGTIVVDDETEIPKYLVGKLVDSSSDSIWRSVNILTVNGKVEDENDNRGPEKDFVDDSKYPGFDAHHTTSSPDVEYKISKNDTYGAWYVKYPGKQNCENNSFCGDFLFIPNAENIKKLIGPGDVVTTTFRYRLKRLFGEFFAQNEITVTIRRPVPLITVEPLVPRKYVVRDDSDHQIRLRLDKIPDNPITVQYQLSTRTFFDANVIDKSIVVGQADGNGEVPLEYMLNILDGQITGNSDFRNTISIRLVDSDGDNGPNGYRVPSGNIGNNLSMTIVDANRLPAVRVDRLFSQAASIDETQSEIWFEFRANHPTPIMEAIDVHYEVTQSGEFTSPAKIGKFTAKIPSTNSIAAYLELPLPIINDDHYEPDGAVTVTVLEDQSTGTPKYKVVEHQTVPPYFSPTASVSVRSDDAKPVVSIAPPTGGSIKEGDDDGFMVTATDKWANEFTVDFTLSESGGTEHFIESGSPTTLTFPPNTNEDSVTRPYNPIHIDSTVESGSGSITATLAPVNDDDHYTLGTPVSATATAEGSDPGVSLSWADGESGEIIDLGLDSYGTISGNSLVAFPASGTFDLEISARESGMAGSAPDIASSTSAVSGFSSEVSTTYGKWQWKDDDSGFRFDPDADAINRLGDEVVTTTLFVRIVDASTRSEEHMDSIDLTIPGTRDPELSISAGGAVTEADGVAAVFTVTSDVNPEEAIEVNYTPTETGNFLLAPDAANPSIKGHTSGTMTSAVMEFSDRSPNADGSGPFTYRLSIPLRDNSDTDSGVQSVTVTLNEAPSGANYTVSTANSSTSVTIIDDESLPVLTLEESGNPSEFDEPEGEGSIIFKVTASSLPMDAYPDTAGTVEIDVRYRVSQTGDFLDAAKVTPDAAATAKLTFAESSGTVSADLAIPIAGDNLGEPDGGVSVTLLNAETQTYYYKLGTDAAKNSHEVKVYDNKDPELAISIGETQFTEGVAAEVRFTITAKFNVRGSLSVNLTVWESDQTNPDTASDTNLYVDSPPTMTILNFNGANTQQLGIPIEDDELAEGTARYVNVRLGPGTGYAVSDDGGSARILVLDDDGTANVPTLSISGPTGTITEANGAVATFTVTSDLDPGTEAIEVNYTVTATGDILLPPDPAPPASRTNNGHISGMMESAMMVFANGGTGVGTFTYSLEIPLRNNGMPDAKAHSVTVTLNTDADGSDYQVPNDSRASILVVDESGVALPFANVTSAREYYTEGEDLVFNISMSPDQSGVVQVSLQVSQQGDFIPGRVGKSIRVSGSGAVLKISTVDDHAVEDEGRVTVQVLDGEEYQPGPNVSATVKIRDNDSLNATPGPRYSVVSSVITEILQAIPPTPPQGESRDAKPTLAIRAINGIVDEGELAVFAVSAQYAVSSSFPVKIKLSQKGDFIIGALDRVVNLNTEQSETEFAVATDNDVLAEADGRITATIQAGSEYLIATQNSAHVIVFDALDRQQRKTSVATALHAVLPDLLANSTARSFDIASNRILQGFSGNPSTSIELNGKSPALTALQSSGEMLNGSGTDWRSFIDDSSFTLALYPEGGEKNLATVWGVGDVWSLSGDGIGGQQSWDGETHTSHFGFDAKIGPGILAGLVMSVSQSEIEYGRIGDSGMSFGSKATAILPYWGIGSDDGNSRLQVMAGYGEKELELKQEQYLPEILTGRFHTVGLSGENRLISNGNFGGLHNLELNVYGKAWQSWQFLEPEQGVVDNLQLDARHIRIAIEGVHDFNLGSGGTVSPTISIGLEEEGRNDKSVAGLDIVSMIEYQAFDGLDVSGLGGFALSGLNRLPKWNIEGSVDYDSGSDGKGILFSMSPSWSSSDTDVRRYNWASELPIVSHNSSASPEGAQLATKIGYGFEVLDSSSVLTPFYSFEQKSARDWKFQVGSRIASNSGADFEFVSVRESSGNITVGHQFNLTGSIRW